MSMFQQAQQTITQQLGVLNKTRFSDGGADHEAWEIAQEKRARLEGAQKKLQARSARHMRPS